MGLTMRQVIKATILAALACAVFVQAGSAGQPGCMEWSKAGPVIAQNGLVPANVIYQKVQKRGGGKIVSQSLCNFNGRFVYQLVVLGPTGEVTNVTVDARTGQF
jgi:uncharacterized membrane protein YkoI